MRLVWIVFSIILMLCHSAIADTGRPKIPKGETEVQVSGVVGFVDSSNKFTLTTLDKETEYLVDIGPLWFHELELTQGDKVTVIGTPQSGILYASIVIRPDESIVKILNPRKPDIDVSDLFNTKASLQLAQVDKKTNESDATAPEGGKTIETNEPEFKIEPRKRSTRVRTKFADTDEIDDDSATSKNEMPMIDPKDLELLKELEPAAGGEESGNDMPDSEKQSLLDWFKGLKKSKPLPAEKAPMPQSPPTLKMQGPAEAEKGKLPAYDLNIRKPQAPTAPLKPQSNYQPQSSLPESIAENFGDKKLSDFLPPITLQSQKAKAQIQAVAQKTPEKPPWDAPINFSQLERPPSIKAPPKTASAMAPASSPYLGNEADGFDAVGKVMNDALKKQDTLDATAPQPTTEPVVAITQERDFDKVADSLNKDDRFMQQDEGVDQSYSGKLMTSDTKPKMSGMKTSEILSIVDQKSGNPQWFGPMNQSKVFVKVPEKSSPAIITESTTTPATSSSDSFFAKNIEKTRGTSPDFGTISSPYKKPEIRSNY